MNNVPTVVRCSANTAFEYDIVTETDAIAVHRGQLPSRFWHPSSISIKYPWTPTPNNFSYAPYLYYARNLSNIANFGSLAPCSTSKQIQIALHKAALKFPVAAVLHDKPRNYLTSERSTRSDLIKLHREIIVLFCRPSAKLGKRA